ncbi:MAG: hypothetical protein ACREEM_02050 [Blastocatellia bacterium]
MKRLIRAMVITSFIAFGCWAAFSRNAPRAISAPLFQEVLGAHGGREAITSITASRMHGVRLTSTLPPGFFERRLQVEVADGKFRRQTADPLGLRTQVELFDGQAGFSLISGSHDQPEAVTAQVLRMSGDRLRAVKFSVETYGLLPLLQRCADPTAEVISQETTPARFSKFRVRTSAGEWNVYADESRLIRKMEIGDKTLRFADYRSAGGLQLPFIERLSVGQQLVYEMVISTIELNPAFPVDYFKPEALARAAVR